MNDAWEKTPKNERLMWDVLLSTMNMFLSLVDIILIWPTAKQDIVSRESQTEYREKTNGVEGDTSSHPRNNIPQKKKSQLHANT